MTLKQIELFMDLVAIDPQPCQYGHFDCSAVDGGPCSDEMLSTHGLDNDLNPITA